jgi:hypothetical protein
MRKTLTSYKMKRHTVSAIIVASKEKRTKTLTYYKMERHMVSVVVLASKDKKDTHILQDEKSHMVSSVNLNLEPYFNYLLSISNMNAYTQ